MATTNRCWVSLRNRIQVVDNFGSVDSSLLGVMSTGDFIRTGQWFMAPGGVSVFDGAKDDPQPRPIVALGSYFGFVRMLGRSTKPLDDPKFKKNHPPHKGQCDAGSQCRINETGYVSIRPSDLLDPIVHKFEYEPMCMEPDDDFVELLINVGAKL